MSRNNVRRVRPDIGPEWILIALALVTGLAIVLGVQWGRERNADAAQSASVQPTGQGFYTAWSGGFSNVNQAPACNGSSNSNYISESNSGDRESFTLPITSVPAGAVITGVTITVGDRGDTNDDGTYRTFARLNGADFDGNSDLSATGNSGGCNTKTQHIVLDPTLKSAVTGLEIGVVKDSSNNNAVRIGTITATITYAEIVANPTLGNSCGFDLVIVIDTSASINDTELQQQKTAYTSLLTALAGTPTRVGVIEFNNYAAIRQTLTSDLSQAQAAINAMDGDVITGTYAPNDLAWTNWQDALTKAQSLFGGPDGRDDLILFSSDGNPTRHNSADSPTTNQPNVHLTPAIEAANAAKSAGTRIISLGVGGDLIPEYMQLLSSNNPNDAYYEGGFGDLGETLAEILLDLCAPSITVHKVMDADGSLATTNDRTDGVGWGFTTQISGGTIDPSSGSTNAAGLLGFKIILGGPTAVVTINETEQSGASLLDISCTGSPAGSPPANENLAAGTIDVTVESESIVTCTYINTLSKPAVTVDKTSTTTTLPASGGPATFTFTVTNTGPVAVTITSLSDDQFGPLAGDGDCQVGTPLGVGASCSFDATFNVPAGAAQTTHVNTFTAVVTDSNQQTATDDDPHTITYEANPLPAVLVDKTSATTTLPANGGLVTFTFTVTNTGPVAVTITSLDDDQFGPLAGDVDCQVGTPLGVGASCSFDATFNVPAGVAQTTHVNTFTAVVTDVHDQTATDDDPHTITYVATPEPSVLVDKTSTTSTIPTAGGPVTFTFTVTNTGPVGVTITSLNDDQFGALVGDGDCQVGTPLGVGASCSFDATFNVPAGAAQTTHTNVFTAVVTDDIDQTATDDDPHTITYIATPQPTVLVDKTSATSTIPAAGGPVTFTFTVTNTGPVAVTITSLSDDQFGALTGDADCQVGTPLGVGASCSFEATFDVPPGAAQTNHVNTFTAVVTDDNEQTATDDDPHTITYIETPLPAVLVDKTSATTTLPTAGGPVTFTFTVTNTGPLAVTITSLNDDQFGALAGDADCQVGTSLGVGGSCSFDATFNVPAGQAQATHVNTFTAVVTDANEQTATDDDPHTITYVATPLPAVVVDKTSVTNTLPTAGGPVTFTFTVTNTGPVAVTITSLEDDQFGTLVGDDDCQVGSSLGVGQSCSFDATFEVPAGADQSNHVNTFTAVVIDANEQTATDDDPHTITYLAEPVPAVRVDKTSVTTTLATSGGPVTFTFTVTNTGPVAVTITSLEDDRFGSLAGDADCQLGTVLAVGQSCSFDETFDVPAGAAQTNHVNTFTTVVTDANQQTATDDDPHTITYIADPLPAVLVDKTSATSTLSTGGGEVTFTFTVTNTGPVPVTITSLNDDKFGTLAGDADCQLGTPLAVGASCSFDGTFDVPGGAAQANHVNTFTAVVTDANDQTATDDDPHTITYIANPLPAVLVDKTASTTTLATAGGPVTFTFTVTNTGPVAVTISSLDDDTFGALTGDSDCQVGTPLGVGASCSFDATFDVPAGAAQATHTNTFTAVVTDESDQTATDDDPHTITYVETPAPAVLVDKTSVTTTLPTGGGSVTFTFTVTNTGPLPVTITSLTDDKFGSLAGDSDCRVGTLLGLGSSCSFDATFTVPAGTALGTHVNTFTAVVTDPNQKTATDDDPHTITYVADPAPAVRVDKTSTTTTLSTSGGAVTFTFTVVNTGPVAATITSLTDNRFGTLTGDADCKVGIVLAVGASCTFNATFAVPAGTALGTHVNTFTAVVTGPNQKTATASDSHTITYVADPTPSVRVDKTSSTTTLPAGGGQATFTFTVTNSGPVSVTISSLTDNRFGTLAGDADCRVGTVLGVGASCQFDATFTVPAGTPLSTHVNTFTAVVSDPTGKTTSANDSHTITYEPIVITTVLGSPPPVATPSAPVLTTVPPRLPATGTGGVRPVDPTAVVAAAARPSGGDDGWKLTPDGVKAFIQRAGELAYQDLKSRANENVTLPVSWLAAGVGLLVFALLAVRARSRRRRS
ncbi:MAG: VWA domain-containing protein [Dehalococcoidia bacterium]